MVQTHETFLGVFTFSRWSPIPQTQNQPNLGFLEPLLAVSLVEGEIWNSEAHRCASELQATPNFYFRQLNGEVYSRPRNLKFWLVLRLGDWNPSPKRKKEGFMGVWRRFKFSPFHPEDKIHAEALVFPVYRGGSHARTTRLRQLAKHNNSSGPRTPRACVCACVSCCFFCPLASAHFCDR